MIDYVATYREYFTNDTPKRKVFISYYHGDQTSVNKFVDDFSDVFIAKTVGIKEEDFGFDSTNPEYIMRKIREEKLGDSTVTIVLIGSCTHSRRYIDWEVKASLQQGEDKLPNGLIAINLPYMGDKGFLPERIQENVAQGYARHYPYPSSEADLRRWIEDAYEARANLDRVKLIENSNQMMKHNVECKHCGICH